jgi:RNA polymerase sigma factor (sigma-70 family)
MWMRDDADLLASDRAEDFGVFYERHIAAIAAYVRQRVVRGDLTFDLVAETFARALEHRATFDARRGPAVAWLIGIARNLIADAARRGRVADAARVRLGMAPVSLDDEQLARVEERASVDLAAALSRLPESQREAVLRRVLAEQEYPEIAEHVGCSEQVVRQRVSRGLAALRRGMEAR